MFLLGNMNDATKFDENLGNSCCLLHFSWNADFLCLYSPYNSVGDPADYSPSSPQYRYNLNSDLHLLSLMFFSLKTYYSLLFSTSARYSPSAPGYSPSSTSQYTSRTNDRDDKSVKDEKSRR